MLVSAVVTTRDRPVLLQRALHSIAAQFHPALELILVDDGSAPEAAAANAELVRSLPMHATLLALPPVPGGHGPALARNHGAARAGGDLLAFLDDDDAWIDPEYLARAARSWSEEVDLLAANQEAVHPDGTRVRGPVWIEDLAGLLAGHGAAREDGMLAATPRAMLQSCGFPHLNATVVRRTFFERLGGFDPQLRYEEDRDFHLRALDAARLALHDPAIVARHHIPARDSASTRVGPDARALDQLRLLDKALLTATRPEIRAYARRHKAYTLKALAQRRYGAGDADAARLYAREALAIAPNPKWLAYTAWISVRLRPPSS